MMQAFVIVLREGVEAFLIVAIMIAYFRKTSQQHLLGAVTWGIICSVLISAGLGYFLWVSQSVHQPLWEGIFAAVTVLLVGSLIIHMWKIGPELKQSMERDLSEAASKATLRASYTAVVFFTIIMISREGMEMMLLLFQVQDSRLIAGIGLGVAAAVGVAFLWEQFGYLVNLKRFFQITALYLLLFMIQIAVQGFHEFTEAGIFPNSEALHIASEPYSTDGIYGKWYANFTLMVCGLWFVYSLLFERNPKSRKIAIS